MSALLLAGAATAAGPAVAAAGERDAAGVAVASCTKTKKVYWGTPAASLPVSSGGSVNCLLGPGSSGSAVKALQHAPARCHKVNLGAGGVDGIYGERTGPVSSRCSGRPGSPRTGSTGSRPSGR
ncbi:peptidoglycan-binding protein [Streptomyces albidoflavus]|uniref:peptidoglycan-binding domain-containing protein n=1 Tax=Streptomyces TaxID=1883 RepID=UPI000B1412D0|nr:peptidoglycan-binding protein [Streptomyces sp. KE1]